MALQAALLLAAVTLSQQLAKKAPVFNLTQLAHNNVGQASSLNYHPGPSGYPKDIYTVLFDPLPFNAHGSAQRLAAFENFVIIVLILTSLRRLRRLPRASFVRPYVLMCVLYTIAFPYAFAALNNLGLIDRDRVLLLPFLLVLLAVPVSPPGRTAPVPMGVQRGQEEAQGAQDPMRTGTPINEGCSAPGRGATPIVDVTFGYRTRVAREAMSVEEVSGLHQQLSNWGRWGSDDQLGTLNLITPAVTAAATAAVRVGRTVSCARPLPTQPAPDNLNPVVHHMTGTATEGYGADYFAISPRTDMQRAISTPSATSFMKAGCTTGSRPSL